MLKSFLALCVVLLAVCSLRAADLGSPLPIVAGEVNARYTEGQCGPGGCTLPRAGVVAGVVSCAGGCTSCSTGLAGPAPVATVAVCESTAPTGGPRFPLIHRIFHPFAKLRAARSGGCCR